MEIRALALGQERCGAKHLGIARFAVAQARVSGKRKERAGLIPWRAIERSGREPARNVVAAGGVCHRTIVREAPNLGVQWLAIGSERDLVEDHAVGLVGVVP